ncbi:hypothetical protein BH18THE2_BH18THE2_25360 [soil metagenome]
MSFKSSLYKIKKIEHNEETNKTLSDNKKIVLFNNDTDCHTSLSSVHSSIFHVKYV